MGISYLVAMWRSMESINVLLWSYASTWSNMLNVLQLAASTFLEPSLNITSYYLVSRIGFILKLSVSVPSVAVDLSITLVDCIISHHLVL